MGNRRKASELFMKKNNSKNKYRDSVGASAKELLNFSLDQLISNFVEDKPSISMHANVTARINDLEKTYARLSNAASVLNYWHSSEKYLDAKGEPSSLPQAGRISLASLVTEAIGRNRARSTSE